LARQPPRRWPHVLRQGKGIGGWDRIPIAGPYRKGLRGGARGGLVYFNLLGGGTWPPAFSRHPNIPLPRGRGHGPTPNKMLWNVPEYKYVSPSMRGCHRAM